MTDQHVTMPKFYFSGRIKANQKSDRDWIEGRMIYIPEAKRQEVADEYERIYLGHKTKNRESANKYLNNVASEYRQLAYLEKAG